jgi:hypothetical protein
MIVPNKILVYYIEFNLLAWCIKGIGNSAILGRETCFFHSTSILL